MKNKFLPVKTTAKKYIIELEKIKPPYIVNGYNIKTDNIVFDEYNEMENFLNGKKAYDQLDNVVQMEKENWFVKNLITVG